MSRQTTHLAAKRQAGSQRVEVWFTPAQLVELDALAKMFGSRAVAIRVAVAAEYDYCMSQARDALIRVEMHDVVCDAEGEMRLVGE